MCAKNNNYQKSKKKLTIFSVRIKKYKTVEGSDFPKNDNWEVERSWGLWKQEHLTHGRRLDSTERIFNSTRTCRKKRFPIDLEMLIVIGFGNNIYSLKQLIFILPTPLRHTQFPPFPLTYFYVTPMQLYWWDDWEGGWSAGCEVQQKIP